MYLFIYFNYVMLLKGKEPYIETFHFSVKCKKNSREKHSLSSELKIITAVI